MTLRQYQRKRNFEKTPEPKGEVVEKKGGALRFVVHCHHASRPHFDLRLEIDGVYKSWAVPKGPSLNPSEQRLAVFVEDHPIAYGDFEGIIPKGNYGAGTVMIWDRGTYNERSGKGADLGKHLEAGKITFVLQGEKLNGEFALVRVKSDNKTWLLVKKHDQFANHSRNFTFDQNSVVSGRSMEEIAADADAKWVRGGVEKTAATKKRPAKPAREASKPTKPKGDDQWLFEEIWEGYRAIAEVSPKAVTLKSRNGIAFSDKFSPITAALKKLKKTAVLEGTIAVVDAQGRSDRTTLSRFMSHGEGDLRFVINDLQSEHGTDCRNLPLSERFAALQRLLEKAPSPLFLVNAEPGSGATALEKLNFRAAKVMARPLASTYRESLTQSRLLTVGDEAKKGTAPKPAAANVTITNRKKIFFPDDGITKGDVIDYYDAISDTILVHLRDRPLSLNRFPNGIGQQGFYQKDVTGYVPRWLARTRIYSPSADRSIDYALCQNKESLLYLANLGCIEFHPWLARAENIDNPDFCVIDLDPDGNSFAELVKTALAVRKVCDALEIPLHPKTSGASGLHLCIPLAARYDFDQSRDLALAIAEIVHAELPGITSLKRSPGQRRGKIYLDCFQNRRGQTIAAAYCIRPLPGAPVSTPLLWKELKPTLSPLDFTMRTTLGRLEKLGDIWPLPTTPGVDLAACLAKLRGEP